MKKLYQTCKALIIHCQMGNNKSFQTTRPNKMTADKSKTFVLQTDQEKINCITLQYNNEKTNTLTLIKISSLNK